MCLYARCVLQTDSGQAPNVRFIAVCILIDKQGTVPEDCNHFAHRSVGSEPNGVNHYADKLRYAVRAFLQDAFSLPPAICRYPCSAAVRIFHANKALCTFSKGYKSEMEEKIAVSAFMQDACLHDHRSAGTLFSHTRERGGRGMAGSIFLRSMTQSTGS